MDTLPRELNLIIASTLDNWSLRQLTLVSKAYRTIFSPSLLSGLAISFSSPSTLAVNIARCLDVFKNTAYLELATSLKVSAAEIDTPGLTSWEDVMLDESRWESCWKYLAVDRDKTELLTSEEQWLPLLDFIERLCSLNRIVWACAEQMPRSVLQKLGLCDIEVLNFSLGSLIQSADQPSILSEQDMAIATAPITKLACRLNNGDDYNFDAMQEIVGQGNLREIALFENCRPGGRTMSRGVIPHHVARSYGVHDKGHGVGRLISVVLHTERAGALLRSWSACTDFARLEVMRLQSGIAKSDLEWLSSCNFQSLRELALYWTGGWHEVVTRLVLSLPQLERLDLAGDDIDLVPILAHCGPALRQFGYSFVVGAQHISLLSTHCPNLHRVDLSMYRSCGSLEEVTTYRLLGGLPRLQHIHLVLVSRYHVKPWRYGDQSVALRDMAMDERLASEIFEVIASVKGEYDSPLETLAIRMDYVEHDFEGATAIDQVMKYIGRSYMCRLRGGGGCNVEEYAEKDVRQRQLWEQGGSYNEVQTEPVAETIKKVWPEFNGANLKKVWHAFPLDLSAS